MNMDIVDKFLKNNRNKKIKIHCIGDAIIDEYYNVKVDRISPEHPVPVMSCQNEHVSRPGGVANVAYQLKHLNVDSILTCFPDTNALNLFQNHKIKIKCKSISAKPTIPIKRRYLDDDIQVAPRHDFEFPFCNLKADDIDDYSLFVKQAIIEEKPDIIILSDYNKGFFSSENYKIIDFCKGVKTIVDPKKGPLEKWKGCTVFKPNSKESGELTGKKDWHDQAKFLYDFLECESVVITFGGEKVVGIYKDDFFEFYPKNKVSNVQSVIGAGDCFMAFFATAVGQGFNPIESSEIAWTAGSVYVQHKKNRPVVPAELCASKIVSPEDLNSRDFKLVFTNGCFDILHKGHIETLKFARSKGDKLVVALNSDESIKIIKGPHRPVVSLDQRIAVMAAIQYVDFVVVFDENNPLNLIKKIQPDVVVKGSEYNLESIVGHDIVKEVYQAPMVPNISTSIILKNHFFEQTQS
jgi:D-beta-D-heptose 7-phosphate kinase / D-beta-D-heptose 1-phosphate adenosyltransferase